MFVIVSTYRAKVGEDDAIIALHEDLQCNQDLFWRQTPCRLGSRDFPEIWLAWLLTWLCKKLV